MFPEDIDDLFREKLDGHASPPVDAEALWARLQAAPLSEPAAPAPDPRLDQLFQQGLSAHATPPKRELWERLEDEHLRPRQRRAAAWWPVAIAAALALLLVAGGAGLWLGFPSASPQTGTVATQAVKKTGAAQPENPVTAAPNHGPAAAQLRSNAAELAATTPAEAPETPLLTPAQKKATHRATRPTDLASTESKASQAASEPPLRRLKGATRQPDAAADQARPVARAANRPAAQPAPATPADELRKAPDPAPAVAALPKPAPTPEIVPVGASELITVDVRTGDASATRPAQTNASAVAAAEAPTERRRLGGRLLQQAGHLVRGERVSLAEVTGLPENVTVRATVAGRSISKSIQL